MSDTANQIRRLLAERILVLDGAMGTMLQRHDLSEADFRGDRLRDHPKDLKGDNDILVLTRPEVVRGVRRPAQLEVLRRGASLRSRHRALGAHGALGP